MTEREGSDRARHAMMAAVSALGLALGVSPAAADPPATGWGSATPPDQKTGGTASAWGSTQQKGETQTNQLKSSQLKSTQLKSSQLKSDQIKAQGMEGGEIPKGAQSGQTQEGPH